MPPSSSNHRPKGIVIAAPHSGSGKTVFSMGLAAALKSKGTDVQIAKAGPGFIDPQFLGAAIEQSCFNLDKWAMGEQQVRARADAIAQDSDLLIVEGMMGMFDGAAGMNGSTADLAEALQLPVLLVVDACGQAQSIAALVHGFATLRPSPRICGVVATQVGSAGHAEMLRDAVQETGIPFVGSVLRSDALAIPSRHLGLVQATENLSFQRLVIAAQNAVMDGVDLDLLLELAGTFDQTATVTRIPPLGQRIAVARDTAFEFAYPHILMDWRASGAELSFFSPLNDEAPSDEADAIFLPGGYPELHCNQLALATNFLNGLRRAATRNALIYGECGGYMVLGETLIDADGKAHRMAGLLSHSTSFETQTMQIGYRHLKMIEPGPLPDMARGHEFHYSTLHEAGTDAPLFHIADASRKHTGSVGGRRGSVMGSYVHLIDAAKT